MKNERRIANTKGIYSLWISWAIAVGALVAVPVLSLYVSTFWLPLVVFLIESILYFIIRYNSNSKVPTCMRLPHLAMLTLFWSSLIMAVINIIFLQPSLVDIFWNNQVNISIPYITILIIAPTMVLVAINNLRLKNNSSICIDCQAHNGVVAERGFLGSLYSQDGNYLTNLFLILGIIMTIISWLYYLIFYINSNINDIDRFVFVWLFVSLYAIILVYLIVRYFSLWLYYCQKIDGTSLRYNSSSYIRYIILCGDYIFLNIPNKENDDVGINDNKIDTPARLYIQYKPQITNDDASSYFNALSGIFNAKTRFLYENTNFNTECNIFHYAYIIDDFEIVKQSRLEGDWYTLPQLKTLISEDKVSIKLVSEMNRIYKIVTSWKSYDKRGYRLYNIKNYKPTFRLCDFKNWDVDFNDITWLFVSANNEDKPFFRIRRIWNKYICGICIIK